MEKFGIFELLDALSAVTAPDGTEDRLPSPEKDGGDAPAVSRPDASQSAFAPPSYGPPPDPPEEKEKTGAAAFPPREKGNAVSALMERHEKMSRRIDKNK